jgi:aminoacylase
MEKFVRTKEFKSLNCGVALDEGLANPKNAFTVFYGERAVWWIKIRAKGPTGELPEMSSFGCAVRV